MTMVKICGLTSESDVLAVNRFKADFAGFVLFFPKSRRNLKLETAKVLIERLDGVKSVAVTVSPTAEQAAAIENAGFDYLQVHGELRPEVLDKTSIPILRAYNISDGAPDMDSLPKDRIAGLVFDSAKPGSGKAFDLSVFRAMPKDSGLRILAGGLDPDNVKDAIAAVRPDCVDVSSGVELDGEGKDETLVRRFIENVREVPTDTP